VIDDFLSGQFNNPLRVIACNTAWELMRRVMANQKPLTVVRPTSKAPVDPLQTPLLRARHRPKAARLSTGRYRFRAGLALGCYRKESFVPVVE
jgi:hypothetical protein